MSCYCVLLAVLLGAASSHANAQTHAIGRLFTTPQERHQLDVARGLIAPPPAPPAPAESAPPPPPPPPPVTVNGVIQRSNGRATVWLNQAPQDTRVHGERAAARVGVTLPSGRQVQVKPGQTLDMGAGTVKDVGER